MFVAIRILTLTAFSLCLLLGHCKCGHDDPKPKEPEKVLPLETQEGLNTLGCKINGKVWVPSVPANFKYAALSASYTPNNGGILGISGYFKRKDDSGLADESLSVVISENFTGEGTYPLSWQRPVSGGTYTQGNCAYRTFLDYPGWLTVTHFSRETRTVSGRFAFTAETHGCGKIEVTEGRFDLKY